MKKILFLTAAIIVLMVAPVKAAVLFDDNLSSQEIGNVPSGWFIVGDGATQKSELTASHAIIEGNDSLPTGKYIKYGRNGTTVMFADLAGTIDTSSTEPRIFSITWNQYLTEGQYEHTSATINRATAFRFLQKNYDTGNDTWYKQERNMMLHLGFNHFGGSKLFAMRDTSFAKSEIGSTAFKRGQWYTLNAYVIANENHVTTADGYKLRAYEYGTSGMNAEEISYSGNLGGIMPSAFWAYSYDYEKIPENMNAFSDLKIVSYSGDSEVAAFKELWEITASYSPNLSVIDANTNLADIEMPAGITKHEWISNNTDYIAAENNGNSLVLKHQDAEDKEMCLTLRLYINDVYTDIYIPVTIEGTDNKIRTGEYVSLGAYNGDKIIWRCIERNEQGAVMIADKIVCLRPFDDKEESDNTERNLYGDNNWKNSQIRRWLNSNSGFCSSFTDKELAMICETKNNTVTTQHDIEEAVSGNTLFNFNIADNNISDFFGNYNQSFKTETYDKFTLPSVQDIETIYNNESQLGKYYNACPSENCILNSSYESELFSENKVWHYWLREADTSSASDVLTVFSNVYKFPASSQIIGVRPICTVDIDLLDFAEGDGSQSNPFVITNEIKEPTETKIQEISYNNEESILQCEIAIKEKCANAYEYIAVFNDKNELEAVKKTAIFSGEYTDKREIKVNLESGKYHVSLMIWDNSMLPIIRKITEDFTVLE